MIESRPSIREVISEYMQLRRSGKEYKGLCPFHSEKTPSFTVNEEKGLFHCFGCGAGGDVIRFIQLIDGVSFKEVLERLSIASDHIPRPPKDTANRRAAEKLAAWLNRQHVLLGVRLRELSRQIGIAQEIPDEGLVESLSGEWEILSYLHEDLQRPEYSSGALGS